MLGHTSKKYRQSVKGAQNGPMLSQRDQTDTEGIYFSGSNG